MNMTIFFFALKRFFRSKSNVAFLCILPLGAVFLPVGELYPLPSGLQYYGIIQLFLAARLSSIIMEDRISRTVLRIGVAPISHFQYLWQNLLAYSSILTLLNAVVVIAGVLVHGDVVAAPLLLFLLYSCFSLTAIGFSLAWYSLFLDKETAATLLGGIIILMAMLGGIMWPIQAMPGIFQRLALFLPTYWLAEAMILVIRGASVVELAIPVAMMFMFSITFLLLGSRRRLA